jgi:hypothetical protein
LEGRDLALSADPAVILRRLAEQKHRFDQRHDHGGETETVREEDYKGHHIVVRTTYRVEVDGVPVEGHLGVTNDGQVHYHAVPNLGFTSAVDLVKKLIDAFPDDFPDPGAVPGGGGHGHEAGHGGTGGHGHGHRQGG